MTSRTLISGYSILTRREKSKVSALGLCWDASTIHVIQLSLQLRQFFPWDILYGVTLSVPHVGSPEHRSALGSGMDRDLGMEVRSCMI